MGLLEDRTAIVTGGSRGIGQAIVRKLVEAGANVVFTYASNTGAAESLVQELDSSRAKVRAIQGDVRDAESVKGVLEATLEQFGGLDILVNNAGILREQMLAFTKEADWDEVLATNLKGAFLFMKAAIRQMARKRFGRIISISSDAALMGDAQRSAYCAAKAGLLGLTRSVARETASQGITVNAVCPGVIETEMIAHLSDAKREAYLERIPARRFGEPAEVANLVVFLAAEESGYITGQVLSVDGGLCM